MTYRTLLGPLAAGLLLATATPPADAQPSSSTQKPNVIIILTDDQGYGDVQSHGNPVIKTPAMDTLRSESVRFTDFHVAPMCTPTRGQLMTGLDAMRNGATAVCQGRSMMRNDLKIMPQYFADAGYATGLFGKWHLGDTYPHRPRFRGFQEVVSFRAWGITSLADYWMNGYFDPVLMHNSVDKTYAGYCTDIFFNEAMTWMARCKQDKKPFFAYIPTNTPHVPEIVAGHYAAPYRTRHNGKPVPANFFGMIANIDENLGKLEAFLKRQGLRDNTILIYMADNGTQNGAAQRLFNAGMRDRKTSVYEGGHRVPCFVRWIDGKLQHGKDIADLTQIQDLLPTLADFCGLDLGDATLDGTSLAGILKGTQKKLDDRMCVVQYMVDGRKWRPAVVLWNTWRLVNGKALFNIKDDPGQRTNLFDKHPDIVKKMSDHYDRWHETVAPLYAKKRFITIGSPQSNPAILYASDWQGAYCDNRGGLIGAKGNGYWDIIVDRDGAYDIELRRWPKESGKRFVEFFSGTVKHGARPIAKARLKIADFDKTVDTKADDSCATFSVNLKAGKTTLFTELQNKDGTPLCGAMYVTVTRE